MKRFTWRAILISTLITALSFATWQYLSKHNNEAILQRQLEHKSTQLENQIKELDKTKTDTQQLQKELEKTKAELQAKRAKQDRDKAYAATIGSVAHTQAVETCGTPKQCIYLKESGNRPEAVNSIGCRGLGQACPGSKLPCSSSDYACQDAWFTNYMKARYGTWENAWAFWRSHRWW